MKVLAVMLICTFVLCQFAVEASKDVLPDAPPPWWCDGAATVCHGGQDPCCIGWWATPVDACRFACKKCGRDCIKFFSLKYAQTELEN